VNQSRSPLKARTVALSVLVVAAGTSLAGCGYNDIPTKDQTAKTAWGDVQTQYQRRSDLIPNLVATVQGYAAQERGVLVDVTNARASATQVKLDPSMLSDPQAFQRFEQAQNQLSGALSRLLVANERYPELKSNENFLALQSQLEGTENRISVARRDYNEAVRQYNTALVTFPSVIWAKTMQSSYKPMNLFSASTQAQSAPTVNFNIPPPAGQSSAPASPPAGGAPAPAASTAPGSPPPK
jgi:LemA protein